jgi:hypothetical protein
MRRDLFLIANIPTSMHLPKNQSQGHNNLPGSGFMQIRLLFGVVLHAAVAALQTPGLTYRKNAVSTLLRVSRIS